MEGNTERSFAITVGYRGSTQRFLAVDSSCRSDVDDKWSSARCRIDSLAKSNLEVVDFFLAVQSTIREFGFSLVRE